MALFLWVASLLIFVLAQALREDTLVVSAYVTIPGSLQGAVALRDRRDTCGWQPRTVISMSLSPHPKRRIKDKSAETLHNSQTRRRRKSGAKKATPCTTSTRPHRPPNSSNGKSPSSIGEAVQRATCMEELLQIRLWLPWDSGLPVHLDQKIHHDKRQRWASQLLTKLADMYRQQQEGEGQHSFPWNDEGFLRAVLAAAIPFVVVEKKNPMKESRLVDSWNHDKDDTPETHALLPEGLTVKDFESCYQTHDSAAVEGQSVRQALVALHDMVGHDGGGAFRREPLLFAMSLLMRRAEHLAFDVLFHHAVEVRWAARGLLRRLGPYGALRQTSLARLQQRVAALPFDIVPAVVDWSHFVEDDNDDEASPKAVLALLQDSIPFQWDSIVTRSGQTVVERRGTAWLAEEGIGALAYSGKLMPPTTPLPSIVEKVMQRVEQGLDLDTTTYFDCALCNLYPNGEAACKFHTDPEHGTYWERLTCVVAAGDSRRFGFRPVQQQQRPLVHGSGPTNGQPSLSGKWSDWDQKEGDDTRQIPAARTETTSTTAAAAAEIVPAMIRLFPGDVVKMWGTCNDDFQHAVYPEDSGGNAGRISLVLKRAMNRGGGRRGHGLAGEGRRHKDNGKRTSKVTH